MILKSLNAFYDTAIRVVCNQDVVIYFNVVFFLMNLHEKVSPGFASRQRRCVLIMGTNSV